MLASEEVADDEKTSDLSQRPSTPLAKRTKADVGFVLDSMSVSTAVSERTRVGGIGDGERTADVGDHRAVCQCLA